MKVILLQDIKGIGKKDDVINSSDGYARNFLFPKKMAVEATPENMTKLKGKKDSQKHKLDLEKAEAEEISKKLRGIQLKIKVKAGENGKIFGGVTAKEISDNLKLQYRIEVDKKKIDLKETIKNIGMVTVNIRLFEGVIGILKVDVIAE